MAYTPASALNSQFVDVAGDVMSGELKISKTDAAFAINDTNGVQSDFRFEKNGVNRWIMRSSGTESGADAGSDLALIPRTDAGAGKAAALYISRQTSLVTLAGDPTAATGAATKQYVDSKAGGGQDTGWRDITVTHLRSPWYKYTTGNGIFIRRIGPHVTMLVHGIKRSANFSGVEYVVSPATGFNPVGIIATDSANGYNDNGTMMVPVKMFARTGMLLSIDTYQANVGDIFNQFTWITDEAWPGTLPGVPGTPGPT